MSGNSALIDVPHTDAGFLGGKLSQPELLSAMMELCRSSYKKGSLPRSICLSYNILSDFNNYFPEPCLNLISWTFPLPDLLSYDHLSDFNDSSFFGIPHTALSTQCKTSLIGPLKPLQCRTGHRLSFRAWPDPNPPQQQPQNQRKKHSKPLLPHSATAATALPDRAQHPKQSVKAPLTLHCLQPHKHPLSTAPKPWLPSRSGIIYHHHYF